MAQIALGLAVSTGVRLLGGLLSPTRYSYNQTETNKLDDLNVPKAGFGWPLSRPYGRWRFNGCPVFWSAPLENIPVTTTSSQSSGGKGGTTTVNSNTENRYYATFAVAICDGPISEIKQIYLNDEIWYNAEGENSGTGLNNDFILFNNLEIYLGTGAQTRSPTIESYEGGQIPSFRHTCYLVIRDLPLINFANRIPTISVVVNSTILNLNSTILDICERVGLEPNVDVTAGTVGNITVQGTLLKQDGGNAKTLLDELKQRYFVVSRYKDGKVEFLRQTSAAETIVAITDNDLASRSIDEQPSAKYKEIFINEFELPSRVEVQYFNVDDGFSTGLQSWDKANCEHYNPLKITTNQVMKDEQALELCYKLLDQFWRQSTRYTGIKLLPSFISSVVPGAIVTLPLVDNDTVSVQVSTVNIGANLLLEIEGYSYSGDIFSATNPTPDTVYTPDLETPYYGDPTPIPLDTNSLDVGTTGGIYLAVDSTFDFNGGAVFSKESTGSYSQVGFVNTLSTLGVSSGSFPLATGLDITNILTVVLERGSLDSLTTTQFDNNSQVLLIDDEQIVAKNAVLISPLTYELTEIKRGLNGTVPASHSTGSQVIQLRGNNSVVRIAGTYNEVGKTYCFKIVPTGRTVTQVTTETCITILGNSFKAYAPINLTATKDAAGNIYLSWTPQHLGGIPYLPESYEIEVGSPLERTLTSSINGVTYTVEQQTTDGYLSAQTSIAVTVYQMTSEVGRGYPGTAVLTPALIQVIPVITDASPRTGDIGDTVTVYGSGFTGATLLSINSVSATGLAVVSDSELTGVIATGTTSGSIVVTTPGGTATSQFQFTIQEIISEFDERLTADRTYYVRTDGNDANTGLSNTAGGAFLTVAQAIESALRLDQDGYTVFIQIANGTYSGAIDLPDIPSAGNIVIQGNSTNPALVTLTNSVANTATIRVFDGSRYWLRNLTITNTGTGFSYGILATNSGGIFFNRVIFGICTKGQILSDTNGFVISTDYDGDPLSYSITAGCEAHYSVTAGGVIRVRGTTITLTGTPDFDYFAYGDTAGIIDVRDSTFISTATGLKYLFVSNVSVAIDNNDLNLFPGDQPGLGIEFTALDTESLTLNIELIRFYL